jgi:S-adenosylmethionine:tRNA ribosyltransferase-isomerase
MVGKAIIEQPSGPSDPSLPFQRRDFHFDLPEHLIAAQPAAVRDHSRLLQVSAGGFNDLRFDQLGTLLRPGDLLVVNNTRVLKARLFASKDSGGRAELLLERLETDYVGLFQVRVSKPLKPGRRLLLADGRSLQVVARVDRFYRLQSTDPSHQLDQLLEQLGSVPLPPYIERAAVAADEERYQTVYNRHPGAAAAPTAGLHFTDALLTGLQSAGVELAEITLHVGAATFQPVRSERLDEHQMHSERYRIGADTLAAIAAAKDRGGRIVAVGTTVVRALESAWQVPGGPTGGEDNWTETDIFITPGYDFSVVDALITNFHLPESTLLMLVSAFTGYELTMRAYRHAVAEGYRFFSYGDAMFLERISER